MSPTISVSIDVTLDLNASDLWPDGDQPDDITAEDVAKLILKDSTSFGSWINEWCLEPDLGHDAVTVEVAEPNPAWSSTQPMFSELAPERWKRTTAAVSWRKPRVKYHPPCPEETR